MSQSQTQENQQELFTDFAAQPRGSGRISPIAKTHKPILISTTLEQVLLAAIVIILVFCLIFFLGVLRGRSLSSSFAAEPAIANSAPAGPVRREAPVRVIPAAPLRVAATAAAVKPYTIQVLTTKKKTYAESEAQALKKSGFNGWAAASGDYFIVCVGTYANKEEARKDLAYFGAKYRSSYLRRR